MANVICTLNGVSAEVGDEYAATLIESGYWVPAEEKKTRAPRRKAAPVEEPKTEE